jgi:hypothetical protein
LAPEAGGDREAPVGRALGHDPLGPQAQAGGLYRDRVKPLPLGDSGPQVELRFGPDPAVAGDAVAEPVESAFADSVDRTLSGRRGDVFAAGLDADHAQLDSLQTTLLMHPVLDPRATVSGAGPGAWPGGPPESEEETMRGFDCVAPDGTHPDPVHFEAETDEGIAEQAAAHIAQYHAALGITDEQARGMIAQGAYDLPAG